MSSTKYRTVFQDMVRQNQDLFDSFGKIHLKYTVDPKTNRLEFNRIGEMVLDTIRRYENQLCRRSEGSGFGKFSGGLAGKFWGEIRNNFPKIDEVGIK